MYQINAIDWREGNEKVHYAPKYQCNLLNFDASKPSFNRLVANKSIQV